MKYFAHLCGAVLAGAAAMGLALAATGASAKTYKYAAFVPPMSEVPRFALPPFNDYLKQHTNGEIQFRVFAGGELLGARDTLSGVGNNIAQAGFVVPAFVVSALPHANLVPDLLAFATDGDQAAGATAETYLLDCPECQEDFAKANTITFGGFGTQAYWLQCHQKISSLADMKGKKVRVAGASSGRWVKSIGAVPVGSMPPNEIVTGMQRGQVDCAIAIPIWLRSMSLQDAVKQVITMPQGLYDGLSIYTFNLDFWKARSHQEKEIMLHAIAKSLAISTIENSYTVSPAEVHKIIKEKKINVWNGGPAFHKAWNKFLSHEVDAVIAGAKERGIKPEVAHRIIDAHLKNLKKWLRISKAVGHNADKFATALWDQVYSKLNY